MSVQKASVVAGLCCQKLQR